MTGSEYDLTTSEGVVSILETCQTEEEWTAACNLIKSANGGYPSLWWSDVKMYGLMARITARWGSDDQIHVYPL